MIYDARTWSAAGLLLAALVLAGCSAGATAPATGDTGGAPTPAAVQVTLRVQPDPPVAGPASFTVDVRDDQGRPLDGATVSLNGIHPGMSHGGPSGDLSAQGGGTYTGSGTFSMAGDWAVTVTVAPPGGAPVSKQFQVTVR